MHRFESMPLLETLLAGRYQVVKALSVEGIGNTYIAEDTQQKGNPKCFVKQLSLETIEPNCLKTARRLFAIEAQTLKKLGSHDRIPRLLSCFAQEDSLYLVQEYIQGETLTNQLPSGKRCTKRWTEYECLQFLEEVLGILEFVHQHGVIHCDVTPDNIIRRSCDGKFVLLNFGTVQPVEEPYVTKPGQFLMTVPLGTFGYLPAEQLTGHPHRNSDLYALGLVGIQALTGLHPARLQIDRETGEISWQTEAIASISKELLQILTQMVRYDSKRRYQSAAETLEALHPLLLPDNPPLDVKSIRIEENIQTAEEHQTDECLHPSSQSVSTQSSDPYSPLEIEPCTDRFESAVEIAPLQNPTSILQNPETLILTTALAMESISSVDTNPMPDDSLNSPAPSQEAVSAAKMTRPIPSLLLLGIWAGVTINALVIAGGLSSLLLFSPSDDGIDVLTRASQQYQAGDFKTAISLAESIPVFSSAYYDAQQEIERWQVDWDKAATQFPVVEKAHQEKRWVDAIQAAAKIPDISFWQNKIAPIVEEATQQVAPLTPKWLEQAYTKAQQKDFAGALEYLNKIPPGTPAYEAAQAKIPEYTEKQRIKLEAQAHELLQKAYAKAQARDFDGAIQLLQQIPKQTSVYAKVQAKIAEYKEKRRIKGNALLQQAYDRALRRDYASAMKLLQQIPRGTKAHAIAQTKLIEYKKKQRFQGNRAHRVTPATESLPDIAIASPMMESKEAMSVLTYQTANLHITAMSERLNPGDLLQEVNPQFLGVRSGTPDC